MMEKLPLGKALYGMVQMQMKLGTTDGIEDLYDALETLKQSLIQRKEEAQSEFDNDEQNHNTEESRLLNLITEYTNEIKRVEQQIIDLDQTISTLNQDLDGQNSQLNSVQEGATQEQSTLENLKTQYETDYNDYTEAIKLLNQAIEKVKEAQQSSSEEATTTVFLQTNLRTFQHISEGMENKLHKVSKGMLVQPLIKYFSQLGSSSAQLDPSSLERVIDALENLRDFYIQGQQELTTSYEQTSELHKALLIEFQNQASNLRNFIIPKTSNQLESNKGTLSAKQNELTNAQLNLLHEQQQLGLEQESWASRVESFEKLIPKYDEQLSIVEQAENIIRSEYAFF